MPAIMKIAKEHNLIVVEDAAQSILAGIDGQHVGAWGETAAFSLHPLKNLNVWGDGGVIVTRSAEDAMALANRLAPEHLVVDHEALVRGPVTAGAVFIGGFTAQAAGDYATGSNHVLPTSGAARFRGGLSASDFVRVMAVQRVTRRGLARLARTIVPLARAEGLEAHAESIEVRLS